MARILVVVALVAFVAVTLSTVNGKPGKGTREFNFNCTGKETPGTYPHPTKCTHYVVCDTETVAYEMECSVDEHNNLLHYVVDSGPNIDTSRCDYPENAGCKIKSL